MSWVTKTMAALRAFGGRANQLLFAIAGRSGWQSSECEKASVHNQQLWAHGQCPRANGHPLLLATRQRNVPNRSA